MDNTDYNQKSSQQQQSSSSSSGPSSSEPIVMHQMEHPGVTCDVCNARICGFRYKCMQCPDFDLCHPCEIKGHHVGHVMMRIPFPEQSVDAIPRYMGGERHEPPFRGRGPFGRHGGMGCGRNSWTEALLKNAASQYGLCGNKGGKGKCGVGQKCPESEQFDWTAASMQFQELLNAWGVPINVADLWPQPKPEETKTQDSNGNASANGGNGNNNDMEHSGNSSGIPPPQPSTSNGIPPQQPAASTFGNPSAPFQPPNIGEFLNNAMQNPQVQQIIQGVTAAAENAAQHIPGANPWSESLFPSADTKSQQETNTETLNQLLSMGFSNDGGWLERLVAAKRGNLQAVLNSLFPAGPTK